MMLLALAATACTADAVQDTAVVAEPEGTALVTAQSPIEETAVPTEQASSTPAALPTLTAEPQPPTATAEPAAAVLPIIGPAPSWDNDVWINTETPLPLEDLRGKVILLKFWTFG